MSRCFDEDGDVQYREDIWYLRSLAMELKLDDTELVQFGKTFIDYPKGDKHDVHGTGRFEMRMAFDGLATAITMALCKRLEFLNIDVEDSEVDLRCLREWPTRYFYLPGLARQRPEGLCFVHTLVISNTLHYDPNVLGLDRVSFLWSLLPNVSRFILFKGDTEAYWNGRDTLLVPEDEPRPEYSWTALPNLKELRFLRCARFDRELPLPAMKRLVSRCTKLEKFAFSPFLLDSKRYPPSRLLQSISSASATLRHLTVNCPIPEESHVDPEYLLGPDLKQFISLESLILDQAVFCHHHHNPETTRGSDCLTDILPISVQYLTVNIHATLAPIIDLISLGEAVSRGEYPNLAYLRVQMTFEDQHWRDADPPATPREWEHMGTVAPQTGRPDEMNEPLLQPRRTRKKYITDAFAGTNVRVEIDFFRRRLGVYTGDTGMVQLIANETADARLIDVDR